MVITTREINEYMVSELCDGHLIPLLKALGDETSVKIVIRKSDVMRYLSKRFFDAGFSNRQVAAALDISLESARNLRKASRRNNKYSKKFMNAVKLFGNPIALIKKCDGYACDYTITRTMVERLIIKKFMEAGYTNRQIVFATGYNRRRVQRIRKKIRENDYD